MLLGQISPLQLESVLDVSRNLLLKFHQNWVSNIGGCFVKVGFCNIVNQLYPVVLTPNQIRMVAVL